LVSNASGSMVGRCLPPQDRLRLDLLTTSSMCQMDSRCGNCAVAWVGGLPCSGTGELEEHMPVLCRGGGSNQARGRARTTKPSFFFG
jgi:hypothetical protein